MRTSSTTSNTVLLVPSKALLTTRYAEDVVSGRVLTGEKVRLSCARHLNDLKRQGTNEFPWVFDEEKGHRPVRYIEKFCRPSQGNYRRLVLSPWQHFVVGSLYGWVHRDTGLRRFREGLIFIGRKNGKTTLISGLSLYAASKDGEQGARVFQLANSKEQARELFDECKAMIEASPVLRRHFRSLQHIIHYDRTKSRIQPLATDSRRLDGRNTSFAAFDEIHEYMDYKLINVIRNSMGSREQPLTVYITTAGYQLDGPLVDYYELADDVLSGVMEGDRMFFYMAEMDEADDIEDPANWIKANPNLGVSLQLDTMIEEWERAKLVPAERSDFITKRFNRFVDSGHESWLTWEIIQRNNQHMDEADFEGKTCVGAFDLSDSEDFTSACLEFPVEDTDKVFVISHSWIPEAKVKADNEKIPYREYEEQGLLTIVPGEYVRKEYIHDWFVAQSDRFHIELIAYDPAKAFGLVESLNQHGFATKVVRQGHLTLGPAIDDLKERFIDGNVVYNENRLLRWYINNVRMVEDRNRNKMPTKVGRYRKIDGFSALLNAHTEVMHRIVAPPGEGGVGFVSVSDLTG